MNQQLTLPSFSPQSAFRDASLSRSSTESDHGGERFPFRSIEFVTDGLDCGGREVMPSIDVRCDKGIFNEEPDPKWTCYRRNYFAVTCSYQLHNVVSNEALFLTIGGARYKVNALGMYLSASVDGPNGKNVELVQHTAKRDNGPKTTPQLTPLPPTPGTLLHHYPNFPGVPHNYPLMGQGYCPSLPFQQAPDASDTLLATVQGARGGPQFFQTSAHLPLPGQNTQHTFDRIQFKQATANNGKRRASQQYFHLSVELWADIRGRIDEAPHWVKVAHRHSDKVIVRGRSPSHYRTQRDNDRNNGHGSSNSGYYGDSGNGGAPMHSYQGVQPGPSGLPLRSSYSNSYGNSDYHFGASLGAIPEHGAYSSGTGKYESATGNDGVFMQVQVDHPDCAGALAQNEGQSVLQLPAASSWPTAQWISRPSDQYRMDFNATPFAASLFGLGQTEGMSPNSLAATTPSSAQSGGYGSVSPM